MLTAITRAFIAPFAAFPCVDGAHVDAMVSYGRPGPGSIGYGIKMYNPGCAAACNPIFWSDEASMDDHDGMVVKRMDMSSAAPSLKCLATNDPYLQSLAYCMSTHCGDVKL